MSKFVSGLAQVGFLKLAVIYLYVIVMEIEIFYFHCYCTRIGIICTVLYTIGYANLYSTAVQYSRVPYCVCSNINENGKTTSNSY